MGATYGLLVLLPLYVQRTPRLGPEWFYGVVGTALAFQLVYWAIGGDPGRSAGGDPVDARILRRAACACRAPA